MKRRKLALLVSAMVVHKESSRRGGGMFSVGGLNVEREALARLKMAVTLGALQVVITSDGR